MSETGPDRFFQSGGMPDFRALFESSPGLYLVLTPDERIVAATDAYLRAMETTRENIVGRKLTEICPDRTGRPLAASEVRGPRGDLRYLIHRVDDAMGLARMSHELRTPLTAILGFGRLLESRVDGAQDREAVQQIQQAGRQLLGLINGVLDLARVESGRLPFTLAPVRLGDAIRRVVGLAGPLAVQRRVELLTAGTPLHDRSVRADPERLHQALLNLVSNGIKYNRLGGRLTVACQTAATGYLRIAVRDTGVGIPRSLQARLFTPFDRLGAESAEGTGLGLTLARRLVEAMHGKLGYESVEGEGTTFWIDMPEADARSAALSPVDARSPVAHADGTVLYIEDDPSHLQLVESALAETSTLRFIGATQGRTGLALAREHHPDVIVTDLHLSDLSGDEVLQEVQRDPVLRPTPVVILSEDTAPGQVRRLLEAGARAYLPKPPDVPRLVQVLERMVHAGVPP
jgi:signal transduction histidine kinase/ActR/RegA family two-component response regulator